MLDYPLCEQCDEQPKSRNSDYCYDCRERFRNRLEAYYERSLSECFRGGESAAYEAEQQAWIQRNLK